MEKIQIYLKELVANKIGKELSEIDVKTGFFELGLDSKVTLELVQILESKVNQELYPTLLFEHQNIEDLSEYLHGNFENAFSETTNEVSINDDQARIVEENNVAENNDIDGDIWADLEDYDEEEKSSVQVSNDNVTKESIAVIGISGRYPGANNIDEFWENLKQGKDCITKLPEDRETKREAFNSDKVEEKWGGFINDVDKFDPLHFKISPAETEFIDPQVRLFLEESWKTFEDAGINISTLKASSIGVFVGSMFNPYPQVSQSKKVTDKLAFNTGWTIANRVSYHLGLTGPSMHINTACSSSLTAVIEACQNIQNGTCEMAIAGGVNLSLDALKWEHLKTYGLLGTSNTSRSFGQGDGYLPGEGVGAVLLKPLSKAIANGDQIYGVIKGGHLNHNGVGSGFTVPNPKTQTELIKESLERSGVSSNNIGYVEVAANGSAIGDPIEIVALSHIFKQGNKTVPIGSVKSYIGHLESASGISQLTKVLLQLKHKTLVPGYNTKQLNLNLELKRTSLKLNGDLKHWESDTPRLAMINNFGAGGANAHIILEEFEPIQNAYNNLDKAIIVLSAKNKDRLKEYSKNLYDYLEQNKAIDVHNIAYTMQTGRVFMEERLAFVASNVSILQEKLKSYLENSKNDVFTGNTKIDKSEFILKGKAGKAYIKVAIQEKELESLAQLWVKGVEIDWNLLYDNHNKPNKISLPTYPFAKESYWVPSLDDDIEVVNNVLHPLLHKNESDLEEQKYTSVFTGKESFLKDYKIKNEKQLPAVAYLELAREAGNRSTHKPITQFKDVNWYSPIHVNGKPKQVEISLFKEDDEVVYEIYSNSTDANSIVNSSGKLNTSSLELPLRLDIEEIKHSLKNKMQGEHCYALFKELGLDYGASFKGINYLYYNSTSVLGKVNLPVENEFVLQPNILDNAIQMCVDFQSALNKETINKPIHAKEINIYGDVKETNWCYIKTNSQKSTSSKKVYDINLLSNKGDVLLSFIELTTVLHEYENSSFKSSYSSNMAAHLYSKVWKSKEIEEQSSFTTADKVIVLVGAEFDLAEKLVKNSNQQIIAVNENSEIAYYNQLQELVQSRISNKNKTSVIVLYDVKDYLKYSFISGLLKTVQQESPKIKGKTVAVEDLSVTNSHAIEKIILAEQNDFSNEVVYENGQRKVRKLSALLAKLNNVSSIKENGVYLITGGTGGLGKLFAEYISKFNNTKLLLTGRSENCKLTQQELTALNATYHPCDVTDLVKLKALIDEVLKEYGTITGIIHAAGILKDSFLVQKNTEDSNAVLLPKIQGTKNIDLVTKHINLDFIMLCSSLSAVLGNSGQTDYASANSWMDSFAQYRNSLKHQGERYGHTLSVNWPLWKHGGMQVDEAIISDVEAKYGMSPLPSVAGIIAFEKLLQNKLSNGVVVYGDELKINKTFFDNHLDNELPQKQEQKVSNKSLREEVENSVLKIVSSILKLDLSKLDSHTSFADYGMDSVIIVNFTNKINEFYEGVNLSPTVFVNHPTVSELATTLLEDYEQIIQNYHSNTSHSNKDEQVVVANIAKTKTRSLKRFKKTQVVPSTTMAIVGMGGRFSTVNSEEELWHNSKSNIQLQIDDNEILSGVPYGQINQNKQQDNGFAEFNLSESEWSQMSPQEQLIFEVLAKAIKNYGITREELSSKSTGVFIAAQEVYGKANQSKESNHTLAYLIPNKISYYLNLKGPSEIVNTYCTSCYVAIHRATQSIINGECEQAIVGGVNLVSEEEMSKALTSDFNGLFSKNGNTKSFSEDAEGFVRSEGAGVILIKSLQEAEKCNNNILGVIKASSVFHGGKGFSLEAPNAKGLKTAIEESIVKSNINVDTIDYIEAHGIANRMADAIELGAIDSAYKKHSNNPNKTWYVGSTKPIIGHSELASGMASLIKVLKAFEHKTIPGIAGLDAVNTELNPNHSLVLSKNAVHWQNGTHPRRAALNSYAVGGVNAHIIIEEYQKQVKNETTDETWDAEEKISTPSQPKNEDSNYEEIRHIALDVFEIEASNFDSGLSPIDYNFDSVKVIQFIRSVNEHFNSDVKIGQLMSADDFDTMFKIFDVEINNLKGATSQEDVLEAQIPLIFPLSEGQKGLWIIQAKNPGSTVYNIPLAFSMSGINNADVVYESAEELLKSYPILRAIIKVPDLTDDLVHEIKQTNNYLERNIIKLSDGEDFKKTAKKLQAIPFDLSKNVIRLHIIENVEQSKTYILFVIHHIVFDGTSTLKFISDFSKIVNAKASGKHVKITTDIDYPDFISQEESYLKSEQATKDLEYWAKQLGQTIEKLPLSYDTKSKKSTKRVGECFESIELIGDELDALKATAKSLKVTLSVFTLTVFKVLLYHLTGSKKVFVKMPTTGRHKKQFENSIGYFINMMLEHTVINPESNFSDMLRSVRKGFMLSFDHIQYPYAKLLTNLDATKGNAEELFPVSFIYQNIFEELLGNQKTERLEFLSDIEQDIIDEYSLEIIEVKTKLTFKLKYREDLFSGETIKNHLAYYKNILEEVTLDSNKSISAIQILSEENRNEILQKFSNNNIVDVQIDKNKCIHDLFDLQAKKTPLNIAVIHNNETLNYKELQERSNQLAIYLQSLGVLPNTFVGVYMHRSVNMVVTLLGILKAGGTYVPIDPKYPEERISYMIKDSVIQGNGNGKKIIITQTGLEHEIKSSINDAVLLVSLSESWNENEVICNQKGVIKTIVTPEDLAYVIYTSGTTGKPKGVLIKHSNAVALINWASKEFSTNTFDTVYAATSYCFDLSVFEMFYTLSEGKILRVLNSPTEMDNYLKTDTNVLINTVPSTIRSIIEKGTDLKNVSIVNLAGEEFPVDIANKLLEGRAEVRNLYGPSEDTTYSTCYRLKRNQDYTTIPIGNPIANTQAYILNDSLQVMPIGVPGRLYLSGLGVAKGYLNLDDLTKQKFLENPFVKGQKMYDTGDLAKWLPDGTIAFLGRVDNQVKVRGFRIELGEIESVLNNNASISQSVVIAKMHAGYTQLVAYYVVNEDYPGIKPSDLKQHLSEYLPNYMVPAFIIPLEALPLTSNGKVNRKLLESKSIDFLEKQEYKAPVTATEKALTAIWLDILELDEVGTQDNFFELGGHSLMAVKLASRIQSVLKVNISISKLFTLSNLESMAAEIDKSKQEVLPPIKKITTEYPPLSFEQQQLWFLSELGESKKYHVPLVFNLKGNLDTSSLEESLQFLVNRHSVLRTTFQKNESGTVYQFINDFSSIELIKKDFKKEHKSEKDIEASYNEFVNEPFDLSHGPLIRFLLISLANNEYIFGLCMHHIISDGWSLNILMKELSLLYSSFINKTKVSLDSIPVDYSDYSFWQNSLLEHTNYSTGITYWYNHLKGYKNINMPLDYNRPKRSSGNGASYTVKLSSKVSRKLDDFSISKGGTLFTSLLTGVYILLNKYSSQDDICIGVPVANRRHIDIENVVGYFVNTVVNRVQFKADDTLLDIFENVKDELQSNQDYQHIPFDKVVEAIKPNREANISPIFQVLVNYINEEDTLNLEHLLVSQKSIVSNSAKFDLTFNFLNNIQGELVLDIEYSTDIFNLITIKHLANNLVRIISLLPVEYSNVLKTFNFLEDEELEKLTKGFNPSNDKRLINKTINELFVEQVIRYSSKIAVSSGNTSISYQELEYRSKQLATYLQSIGVKSGTLVGICMNRSINAIISILGILRAGAAYVPIDPDYPLERISYLIDDSIDKGNEQDSIKLILTEESLHDILKSSITSNAINVLTICSNWEDNKEILSEIRHLENVTTPNSLAYVIYTSGSTGKPKGVLVEHKSIVRLVKHTNYYKFSETDVLLATGALSFDATTFEFFGTLLNGSKLIIPKKEVLLNNDLLHDELIRHKVNVAWFTSSWLNHLIDYDVKIFSGLKTVLAGGEKLSASHIKKLRENYGELRIINGYGPTENTTFSLTHEIKEVKGEIPIGKPINNSSAYIVDDNLQLLPLGVIGEICLGGEGVARGYLNRPHLTKEKFVPNPYAKGMLYKTGDLGKWLPDGTMAYMGRIDHQVKIRGFRIELGEIETVLNTFQGINNSVVIVKNQAGNKQLVAYYEGSLNESDLTTKRIKEYLSKSLPGYMVPSFIISIDSLPLTPNGKVNRKLLEAKSIDIVDNHGYVKPVTLTQVALTKIWSKILQVSPIGLNDNFFDLGGHSLLVVKLMHEIQNEFNVNIQIAKIFEFPTLQQLSKVIDDSHLYTVKPIKVVENSDNYPLSFAQQRMLFLDELGQGSRYHIPIVLKIEGLINEAKLEESLNHLINRHQILRTTFKKNSEGVYHQYVSEEYKVSIQQEDYSNLSAIRKSEKSLEQCHLFVHETFDLTNGPLFKNLLIKLSENEYILSICMHHIISDGWSMNILIKELSIIYSNLVNNVNINLPLLPVQYKDYAVWQRKQFEEDYYKKGLSYWVSKLKGYSDLLLPTDFTRPNFSSGNGKKVSLVLKTNEKLAVANYCANSQVTLFASLLTSVYVVLSKFTNQNDICVGIPFANRGRAETEGLIGFFVNTIVSRLQLTNNVILKELVIRVQNELIKGQEHQNIPFDLVVDALKPNRDTGRTPIFQVLVNHIAINDVFNFANTQTALEPLKYDTSKFDLTFNFIETSGNELVLSIDYNTDIFSSNTADRLLNTLHKVITDLPTSSEEKLADYDILSSKDKEQLIVQFNKTEINYPNLDTCIHELFQEKAKQVPDNIALVYENTSITYEELDKRSNQLAIYLQKLGVQPDTLIGICMERSVEMIVAMLGVLKSGGAYVPIDPDYPSTRIKHIINDSVIQGNSDKLKCLIVHNHFKEKVSDILSEELGLKALYLNSKWSENEYLLKEESGLIKTVTSQNLSYVIYTSGSTGKPKGVLVEHKNVINLLNYQSDFFEVGANDKFVLFSNFSFDASVEQIFLPLLNGATLYILPKEHLLDTDYFIDFIKNEGITHLHAVPLFLKGIPYVSNTKLKRIISGGDIFNATVFENWGNKGIRIIDKYGPTETTVSAIQGDVTSALKNYIGKPLGNVSCYILSTANQVQPVGVPGELYIGGKGVTRGYLNRDELTNQKFIDNPFGEGKLYKTGDLARWLSNGDIEFLGRIDYQVKIRGYRIELGEIEGVLNQYEGINDSVVVVKEHFGEKLLVAYCEKNDDEQFKKLESIEEYMTNHLPAYMIPSFIEYLLEIPVTPNGKADRKKLTEKQLDFSSNSDNYILPKTSTEKQLATIFKNVLNVESVGIRTSFFELGGHSLLAIQLLQSIRNHFKSSAIQLKDIIRKPTIENLAAQLDGVEAKTSSSIVMFEEPKDEKALVTTFIIPGMPGIVDGYFELAQEISKVTKGAVYGLQMKGVAENELPNKTPETLALHNINSIKECSVINKINLVAHSYGGLVVYEMLKRWDETLPKIESIILVDSHAKLPKMTLGNRLEHFVITMLDFLKITISNDEVKTIAKHLAKATKIRRKELMYDHLLKNGLKTQKDFFFRVYDLYETSTSVKFKLNQQLDANIILIKAKQSAIENYDEFLGWKPYYSFIDLINVEGTHFDMVKASYAANWLKKTENNTILLEE